MLIMYTRLGSGNRPRVFPADRKKRLKGTG
jgi:hypothetical protein